MGAIAATVPNATGTVGGQGPTSLRFIHGWVSCLMSAAPVQPVAAASRALLRLLSDSVWPSRRLRCDGSDPANAAPRAPPRLWGL